MAEPVEWRADGIPRSARFDDIYHTETGALAQSRHVFLAGCGLPGAWADQPQWRILETGFGFGLNFLTTWQAWRADPQRPRLLHFVSIEAYPVSADDLLRAASACPEPAEPTEPAELTELAQALAAQWHGLLPGFHRLSFDAGRVLLTLCIGDVQAMLRAQSFEADSIFLDGFSPDRNPAMWSPATLRDVSRFARQGTGIATWTIARAVRDALTQRGFQLHKARGLPPKRDRLEGRFDPAWTIKRRLPAAPHIDAPGRCAVIGAGLAGAAVAASLARRGWQVTVLDAADQPAAGASGAPAGLLAPHVSPDDALLSRLTRAGVRATWQQLEALLGSGRSEGLDHGPGAGLDDESGQGHECRLEENDRSHRDHGWRADGVLERRSPIDLRLPASWSADGPNESWFATPGQLQAAGLPGDTNALWHARAGWVRPARLVNAWLTQPGIALQGNSRVATLERQDGVWTLRDAQGQTLAQAERVVIAAGFESARWTPALPLQPVRGQLSWGRTGDVPNLPAVPVNGDGHLIPHVPDADGALWLTGATFDRDSADATPNAADIDANRERLARLHPTAAETLAPAFAQGRVNSWAGVRCASADRRPLVGPLDPHDATAWPDVWLCSAMGSRGLSFAALCAELLAARWHGEPLPLPGKLAHALDTLRLT